MKKNMFYLLIGLICFLNIISVKFQFYTIIFGLISLFVFIIASIAIAIMATKKRNGLRALGKKFEKHIIEFYKYSTGEEFDKNRKVHYIDDKSRLHYQIADKIWIRLKEKDRKNESKDYKLSEDETIVSFLPSINYDYIKHEEYCRKLTKNDKKIFEEFLSECNDEDKDSALVSLDDEIIYGLIYNDKILCVSSLWNIGPNLSDVGVLTHPDHRRKGFAEAVCKTLIKNEDKLYLWRCENNDSSLLLSKKLGFIESGIIRDVMLN